MIQLKAENNLIDIREFMPKKGGEDIKQEEFLPNINL